MVGESEYLTCCLLSKIKTFSSKIQSMEEYLLGLITHLLPNYATCLTFPLELISPPNYTSCFKIPHSFKSIVFSIDQVDVVPTWQSLMHILVCQHPLSSLSSFSSLSIFLPAMLHPLLVPNTASLTLPHRPPFPRTPYQSSPQTIVKLVDSSDEFVNNSPGVSTPSRGSKNAEFTVLNILSSLEGSVLGCLQKGHCHGCINVVVSVFSKVDGYNFIFLPIGSAAPQD